MLFCSSSSISDAHAQHYTRFLTIDSRRHKLLLCNSVDTRAHLPFNNGSAIRSTTRHYVVDEKRAQKFNQRCRQQTNKNSDENLPGNFKW